MVALRMFIAQYRDIEAEQVQSVAETQIPYVAAPVSREEMIRFIKELESPLKAELGIWNLRKLL